MSTPRGSRVAIVTGAASGIGRAIAVRLAADGFDVAINDLPRARDALETVADEVRDTGRRAVTVLADVSVEAEVDELVGSTVAALGRLDVMVANAGIVHVGPLLDLTVDEWDHVMAVNARGTFLCYRAAARQMIEQGEGGKLIGAASVAAHQGGVQQGPYSASKFALRGLTHAAAQEWAPHGITVNVYSPGVVDTPMWEAIDEIFTSQRGQRKGEAMEGIRQRIVLGRVEHPRDVAGLVSYLASPDADYMTGQSVLIDGGMRLT
jgi:meso-butanediol dehydrogenase / (S,S)-butanediol dehydrogenase / diacetyl reductase